MNDVITVSVVIGFVLFVYAGFRKITIREALEEVKDFLSMKPKEE